MHSSQSIHFMGNSPRSGQISLQLVEWRRGLWDGHLDPPSSQVDLLSLALVRCTCRRRCHRRVSFMAKKMHETDTHFSRRQSVRRFKQAVPSGGAHVSRTLLVLLEHQMNYNSYVIAFHSNEAWLVLTQKSIALPVEKELAHHREMPQRGSKYIRNKRRAKRRRFDSQSHQQSNPSAYRSLKDDGGSAASAPLCSALLISRWDAGKARSK